MYFYKVSLSKLTMIPEKKHYESVSIIPRNRSYHFDIVKVTKMLYLTPGQAFTAKLGQNRPNF